MVLQGYNKAFKTNISASVSGLIFLLTDTKAIPPPATTPSLIAALVAHIAS